MIEKDSKVEKKRVSILGCGWLGLSLAQRLRNQHSTWEIKVSTTSKSKVGMFDHIGLHAYLLDLTPSFPPKRKQVEAFFDTDTLLISLPPRLTKNEPGFYQKQIESVISEIQKSPIKEVIFISSTGIYPELNRIVFETDVTGPENSASAEMVIAENLVQTLRPERTVTIARLGGLLGYNRIPGKYVQGQKNMTTGEIPVNYIHREDAAGIIALLIETGARNETYNIVAPIHPVRREVYNKCCDDFGWEAPTYSDEVIKPDFKVISGDKFSRDYSYDFLYPDPLSFYYSRHDLM